MAWSTSNGLRIWYEVAGEGPPIVLIHANPYDHRLWLYQTARWSAFHHVISVDIRGYGRSDKPETPFTLSEMAEDVLGVCDDLGIAQAVFAGCSVGSGMALCLGLEHPERVNALVLVGGASRPGGNIAHRIAGYTSPDLVAYQRFHLAECWAPGFTGTKLGGWMQTMFSEGGNLSGQSIARIFEARGGADLQADLPQMRIPTIVVNGIHDMSLEAGRETASLIPDAEHAIIQGAGHACQIENPADFDACVLPFLARHGFWNGPRSST